jgi:hypothetical protein
MKYMETINKVQVAHTHTHTKERKMRCLRNENKIQGRRVRVDYFTMDAPWASDVIIEEQFKAMSIHCQISNACLASVSLKSLYHLYENSLDEITCMRPS